MTELFVPGAVWTINSERKNHHMVRAQMTSALRQAAKLTALSAKNQGTLVPFDGPVEIEFTPHQVNKGPAADTANHLPACKAVLDGIVDAGIIPDDTPEWVALQCFLPPVKVHPSKQGVHIRITSL